MAVTNKSPDSWHGSLNALYSIGPGFSAPNGSLILYSNFVSVRYTAYDVAAFLRSSRDSGNFNDLSLDICHTLKKTKEMK